MKILIICPRLQLSGGVSNYYNSIQRYLPKETNYFYVGAKKEKEVIVNKIFHLFCDLKKLYDLLILESGNYEIIHLNPSFSYASLIRDGLLLLVAKKFQIKCIVFFRGWNDKFFNFIQKYFCRIFYFVYNKTDAFIVLGSKFKQKLTNLGFEQPIFVETTLIDDQMLKHFSIEKRISRIESNKYINLLFLSRIEKEKGITEAIDTLNKLLVNYQNLRLLIVGKGSFLNKAKKYSKENNLSDKVIFKGHLDGKKKLKILLESDIFILPTYHTEGMPNSVIEAMAFGLPVITRKVGGLNDFFKNGKYGFFTKSKNPEIIASLVEKILLDKKLWIEISIKSHHYAVDRFLSSKVSKRLLSIYCSVLN